MRFFVILIFFVACSRSSGVPMSDHFNGETFFNPGHPDENTFWDVLKWKWTSKTTPWPEWVENKSYPAPVLPEGKRAIFTFVNHATFLILTSGLTVLTDPVFSERVSPVPFVGPKRHRAPGIEFENLPAIDVVVISHSHYDHMDKESLQRLDGKFHPLFIVPLKNRELLLSWGLENVVELDWWQEQKVKGTTVTLCPALHWSNRTPWDRNERLWGSYMISSEEIKIYFGGDTGYGEHFRDIRMRLGAPDVSLLPIGAYEPRWFMKLHHINPEEAVRAHEVLGAGHSLGMHFGTFQLTDEGIDAPVKALKEARKDQSFTVLDQGESQIF